MADFDLPNVNALTRAVRKDFAAIANMPSKDYLDIATEVRTNSHTVDYAWLGELPMMREWIDARDFKTLKDYQYTISKKDWEASIAVKRDDFLFDNLGIVKPKIQQLAYAQIEHYNSLVFGLINTNGVCYDGKKMFDTHRIGSTYYTNKTDAPLSEDALWSAMEFMRAIKDEQGRALKVKPSMLLVAPDLERTANQILGRKVINGSDNVSLNIVKLKVVDEMASGTWCLIDNTKPLKPFILQITKVGELEENTYKMFDNKQIRYGIDSMDNAGYGFWQLAYFSDGTGSAAA